MAKHDSLRKLQRNKALYEYRLEHTDASWEEIGQIFGISKQRACEICQNEERRLEAAKQLQTA